MRRLIGWFIVFVSLLVPVTASAQYLSDAQRQTIWQRAEADALRRQAQEQERYLRQLEREEYERARQYYEGGGYGNGGGYYGGGWGQQPYYGGGYRRGGIDGGAAAAAILGLAIGAIAADAAKPHHRQHGGGRQQGCRPHPDYPGSTCRRVR